MGDDPDLLSCKNWAIVMQRTGNQVWVRRRRKVQSRLENVSRNHDAGFVQILSQNFLTRFCVNFNLPTDFDAFSLDTAHKTWQLISANVNRESSANIEQVNERLLRPAFARTHFPVILALQETKSWDVGNFDFVRVCFVWSQTWVHHSRRARSDL